MAILGVPYDVMYLSRGRSGLTNVLFFIRKPDGSIVGGFPMYEGEGPFAQCYFGEFYSSIDDPQGKYFGRIISPSEGVTDSVAFELSKPGNGEGEAQFYIPPSNLKATVLNTKLSARLEKDLELNAELSGNDVTATLDPVDEMTASVTDNQIKVETEVDSTVGVIKGC